MPLALQYRVASGSESASIAHGLTALADVPSRVLGMQLLGMAAQAVVAEFPVQQLRMPCLGGPVANAAWSTELWLSASDCQSGSAGRIRYNCDGQLLYGTLEIRTADLPDDGGAHPLQQATEAAYAQIFSLLDAQGYPHLWRVWNYLADINDASQGLELYRQFNIGRHQAFEAHGRLQRESVPAACALGTRDSDVPLSIAFLAAKQASLPIENPRQVAAYEYPSEYGPRSPTFARAALARFFGQDILFISGTASIVGHASMHADDVLGQARETLNNIQCLLDEATRIAPRTDRPWCFQDLSLRIYLRRESDYASVRALLIEVLGPSVQTEFVQADVCRAELLLEIEAVGLRPTQGAPAR